MSQSSLSNIYQLSSDVPAVRARGALRLASDVNWTIKGAPVLALACRLGARDTRQFSMQVS